MHSVRSRPPARAGQKRPRSENEAAEEDSGQDYEYDDNEWIGGGDDNQSEEGELRSRRRMHPYTRPRGVTSTSRLQLRLGSGCRRSCSSTPQAAAFT